MYPLETLRAEADYASSEVAGDNRLAPRPGYTSAVDMWAVGCLTTSLFIGQSYFAPTSNSKGSRRSSIVIRAAAAECDLADLDYAPEWSDVETQVKDFIKGLLCLDENKRLTVKEALRHPWFSTAYHKGSSHQFYENLIRNWKPVSPAEDFAEDLRVFIGAVIPKEDVWLPSTMCRPKSDSWCQGTTPTLVIPQSQNNDQEEFIAVLQYSRRFRQQDTRD